MEERDLDEIEKLVEAVLDHLGLRHGRVGVEHARRLVLHLAMRRTKVTSSAQSYACAEQREPYIV